MRIQRLATLVAVGLVVAGTASCLVGRTENTKYSGRYVGEDTLQQIEPGDTRDEVVSLLGEPTTRTKKESGKSLWKYSYRKATTKTGAVFLLVGSTKTTETEGAAYVEFDSSYKVTRTWSER